MNKYQETIIRFKKYKELADDISKLQKALDKACELLSESDCVFPGDYPWAEKEQWKEWLLKDKDAKEM